jgi:hypothetical protein
MDYSQFKMARKIMICMILGFIALASIGCTLQWAMKNKNTDCGFTNDNVQPGARKDPMTFYGEPNSSK